MQVADASKSSAVAFDDDVVVCTVAVAPSVVVTSDVAVVAAVSSPLPQAASTLPRLTVPSAASACRRSSFLVMAPTV